MNTTTRLRATTHLALVVGCTGLALLWLNGAGTTLPPWPRWTELWTFLDHNDPVVVTFSALRVVAMGLCWYLLASTALGTLARATRVAALVRAVDVVTLPSIRRLVHGVVGVGMAVSVSATAMSTATIVTIAHPATAMAAPRPDSPPTMRVVQEPGPTVPPGTQQNSEPPVTMRVLPEPDGEPNDTMQPPVTMHEIEPDGPPATSTPTPPGPASSSTTVSDPPSPPPAAGSADTRPGDTPGGSGTADSDNAAPTGAADTPGSGGVGRSGSGSAGDPMPSPTPAGPSTAPTSTADGSTDQSPPPTNPTTWTIQPGDHLWHVSQQTLTRATGVAPTDAATATYLHTLIAANVKVFAVPGNPDLVFPGQVFTLPAVA